MYFNNNESLFKNLDKAKDLEMKNEEDGNQFQMILQMPESITYMCKSEDGYLQTQNLMGKDFLIKDKMQKYNWKVTTEQKKILNYVCQKAVLIDTSKNVVVWFTPQIPVSIGPNALNGLPGMILALEQDNGERTVIATAVEELPSNFAFEKPTKGKQVSKVEFEKIREDKMKEMGAVNGGGGTGVKMIIRQERN
jgi:GLPGLI family protein